MPFYINRAFIKGGKHGIFYESEHLHYRMRGTGGNLIARLARFLSGDTGNLVINVAIADGDTVEYKNMDRQPFDGERPG